MGEGQTLFERLELKYWVDDATVDAIRREVLVYCEPDRHMNEAGVGYSILSLSFDTPTLLFHRAKMRKDADRLKLRARVYDETGPVHLEVKRKTNDIIRKVRVTVPREGWVERARGVGAPLADTRKNRKSLETFAHLLGETGAEPKLLVRYDREAYESTVEDYARVTFDRHICAAPADGWNLTFKNHDFRYMDSGPASPWSLTLLELKCETRMPYWMMEMIRRCELERGSFSKYCTGITRVAAQSFQDPIGWGLQG